LRSRFRDSRLEHQCACGQHGRIRDYRVLRQHRL
jgi:hypothetical protein